MVHNLLVLQRESIHHSAKCINRLHESVIFHQHIVHPLQCALDLQYSLSAKKQSLSFLGEAREGGAFESEDFIFLEISTQFQEQSRFSGKFQSD